MLQRLGFGVDIAIGAALASGASFAADSAFKEDVLRWKAAALWVEALREGRNYPANPEMRSFFPQLSPPRDRNDKNLLLEVLYTEIAKIRQNGSRWTWHLPKRGYEDTIEYLGLKPKG